MGQKLIQFKNFVLKTGIFAVLILLTVAPFSGCLGDSDNKDANKETITITDAFGRTVEVPDNPDRIAVSGSGSMRFFVYLGVVDRVIAVDYQDSGSGFVLLDHRPYSLAHPEIKDRPFLGTGMAVVDAERLLIINPDVLFYRATSAAAIAEADRIQDRTGIPVVLFFDGNYITDKERIDETLLMLGRILHREQRAQDVIQFFELTMADLENRVRGAPAPDTTVFVGGVSYMGARGLNGTNPIYFPFTVLNLNNVAGDLPLTGPSTGFAIVSQEIILQWDPDIIFIDVQTLAAASDAFSELRNDPSYRELTAVRTGNIFAVAPHTYMGVNHETALANSYFIGKLLFPEQFEDIDPVEKAN